MWKSTVNGKVLHFHLAGINNQNFLARDEETGSWWQQVTGLAISGPLKGSRLQPVLSDELTFGLWQKENPAGQVLKAVAQDQKEYESNWESEVAKLPVTISFKEKGMNDRDILIGLDINGVARAYPITPITTGSPLMDRVGGVPVLLLLGPDKKSIRVFQAQLDGANLEFFRKTDSTDWTLVDSSGSNWDFRGCALDGASKGKCLSPVSMLKDYWFDWRNYHPNTTVYRH